MSGHSKWAQIKRQKGALDIKRGQTFTKIANAITVVVKQGGGVSDPEQNFRLRLEIEKAKTVNMPKENIERAIERGMGKSGKGDDLQEVVYEGFGPSGVAIIVEATTDNKKRTTPEIKSIFEKNGGTMGNPGAVSYQFEQKGLIIIDIAGKDPDNVFLDAASSGALDIETVGDEALVYTDPSNVDAVKRALSQQYTVKSFELTRKPTIHVSITEKDSAEKVLSLVEKLEAADDVQKVYANFDIPEHLL